MSLAQMMHFLPDMKLKKRLHVLEADIITIKKNIDLMALALMMNFLPDMFRMTTIVLVSNKSLSY